jgi:hypothetical protein
MTTPLALSVALNVAFVALWAWDWAVAIWCAVLAERQRAQHNARLWLRD